MKHSESDARLVAIIDSMFLNYFQIDDLGLDLYNRKG